MIFINSSTDQIFLEYFCFINSLEIIFAFDFWFFRFIVIERKKYEDCYDNPCEKATLVTHIVFLQSKHGRFEFYWGRVSDMVVPRIIGIRRKAVRTYTRKFIVSDYAHVLAVVTLANVPYSKFIEKQNRDMHTIIHYFPVPRNEREREGEGGKVICSSYVLCASPTLLSFLPHASWNNHITSNFDSPVGCHVSCAITKSPLTFDDLTLIESPTAHKQINRILVDIDPQSFVNLWKKVN